MNKIRLAILSLVVIALGGCIPETPGEADQVTNFEALWKIMDEHYCFFEEKGVDWNEVHDRYLAKLKESEQSTLSFFYLLSDMLNELKDGHVNLYSDFDISGYPITSDPTTGLNIYARRRDLSGRLMISGGMRYGLFATKERTLSFGYMSYGSFSSGIGNLPVILSLFKKADAIILDLRGNGGGSLDNCDKLLSYFIKEKCLIGYTVHKTGPGHHEFSKPKAHYISPSSIKTLTEKPVLILQDRSSYSATNDFLYKVRSAKNVIRIGEQSGGGAGMPASAELPNGWRVRYSSVKSYDKDMVLLEGGVAPDIEVHNDSFYENPAAEDRILITAIKKVFEIKGVPYPTK